jgi:hypothetical protein
MTFIGTLFLLFGLLLNPQAAGVRMRMGAGVKAAGGGGVTITFIQATPMGTTCAGGTTCPAAPFGSNNTAGNGIIAGTQWFETSSTNHLTSCSDSQSNSYVVLTSSLVTVNTTTHYDQIGVEFCITTAITGGSKATVTCHYSSSASYEDCNAAEFSYTGGTPSYTYTTGSSTGSANPSAGSLGGVANSVGFTISGIDNGGGSTTDYTAGSGWTLITQNGGGAHSEAWEYQASSLGLTGNFTTGSSGFWVASFVLVQ